MKKRIKQNLLVILASVFCIALAGVFALNINVASAASEETVASKENFALISGASVRADGEGVSGIRFKATVKSSYISELNASGASVEYFMLIAPKKSVSSVTDLTVETIQTYKAAVIKSTLSPESGKDFDYYAAILYDNTGFTQEQLEKAYSIELVARPYVVVTAANGEKSYIYADTSDGTPRSMRQVAYLALQDMAENGGSVNDSYFNSILSYCEAVETKAVCESSSIHLTKILSEFDRTASNGAVTTTVPENIDIHLYTDIAAWAAAESDLADKFTSDCWTIDENGVPVWKALAQTAE